MKKTLIKFALYAVVCFSLSDCKDANVVSESNVEGKGTTATKSPRNATTLNFTYCNNGSAGNGGCIVTDLYDSEDCDISYWTFSINGITGCSSNNYFGYVKIVQNQDVQLTLYDQYTTILQSACVGCDLNFNNLPFGTYKIGARKYGDNNIHLKLGASPSESCQSCSDLFE